MSETTGQHDQAMRQLFVDKFHQLWRTLRAELMEKYGLDRDKFTAMEICALRAIVIDIANKEIEAQEAAQPPVKATKPRKPLTR